MTHDKQVLKKSKGHDNWYRFVDISNPGMVIYIKLYGCFVP